ncbi:MAG: 1-acyl-sn-glycerol-3-phosphate acyltransferase [Clostridia bacterium]|nr:1-acyl-sn-glycerol-3-phosphate acyltransferase [Clostridia bacterium]
MSSIKEQKKKDNIFSPRYFIYDFIKWTGAIPMALWLRPKVYYAGDKKEIKKQKAVLIMSNHTGMLDPVIMHFAFVYRRLWFLALDNMFKKKFSSWFFRNINCIEIKRENMNIASYKNMIDYLDRDKAVCIFPEGQIETSKGQLQQFKLGITFISILNKTPIIPVYIVRRKNFWHRERIVVGKPVKLYEYCSKIPTMPEIENAGKILYAKEQELKQYYENNIRRKK